MQTDDFFIVDISYQELIIVTWSMMRINMQLIRTSQL